LTKLSKENLLNGFVYETLKTWYASLCRWTLKTQLISILRKQKRKIIDFIYLVACEISPLLLMAKPLGLALSPGRTASDTTCWNNVPSWKTNNTSN
jgi:hypothetical protein